MAAPLMTKSGLYADPRADWLALHVEDVLDPHDRSLIRITICGTARAAITT